MTRDGSADAPDGDVAAPASAPHAPPRINAVFRVHDDAGARFPLVETPRSELEREAALLGELAEIVQAVFALPYYRDSNPGMVAGALATLECVLTRD
ncbi:hypothetical protein QT381_14560 [Galbitalea sp. SE-J8]|uniref:hypothetical protein n=1 Tax=Galbitalea sp. SE-J8 TaxID=3054952 RepID=UPI00259D1CE8|nr:hypothetical protein [Galbitalea sp. SE-J8]MDM4764228.1 hypothetical protein [Galbitalea sp. SE-J8]